MCEFYSESFYMNVCKKQINNKKDYFLLEKIILKAYTLYIIMQSSKMLLKGDIICQQLILLL
ncbi:MAG: hypothetical protein BHW57_03480 [Azospirillum sp. 47_25]|nr:MAG: hypothetical protein BHW57_03480 [Azospirillum sp. 47_25]